MSDMAKEARAAMKAKASRLTTADPHQKVDSSTWTPPEPLNAEVKTGLRPISRRAFKSGGKVAGAKAKMNLGKSTRTGNKPITPNNIANKDVKAANEDRMGLKHVGGLKTGGKAMRKGRDEGGKVDEIAEYLKKDTTPTPPAPPRSAPDKTPDVTPEQERIMRERGSMNPAKARCYGGKTKKADGGAMSGAQKMMKKAQETAGVPAGGIYGAGFSPSAAGAMSPAGALGKRTMKRGGMAHPDEKADMALIKKMVKPSAMKRKGKAIGGIMGEMFSPALMLANAIRGDDKKRGGRAARKEGGGVFSGPGYPGKVPGVTGGRIARATGGKTKKGKTNINIVIAAGKPAGTDMMDPMGGPTRPPGMDGGPGGLPVPVPPPQGMPMGAGAPMPMPMPMPMPAAGGAPTPRKSGGRLTAKASSYKDMTAGAGSGEGRLQKTDIAKARMGRKTGGKAYRSYKDMDAGAGSGMGRLEKTEIQAHKR